MNRLFFFLFIFICSCHPKFEEPDSQTSGRALLPDSLAGMSLSELRDDYRARLFDSYLPFWEHGGIDTQYGGFICHLTDNGTPVDGEKNLWYQGRGLWVYSFLYDNFGSDSQYLDIARNTYEFMVSKMYAGDGCWYELVNRDGAVLEDQGASVYGQLFAANGLAQYFKASGDSAALKLALVTLHAALERYDRPDYRGVFLPGDLSGTTGIRTQGHSMVIVRLLTQLLSYYHDSEPEALAERHVKLITERFYNPEFGIVNEYLDHDYNRIPTMADRMFTGHSVETAWMLMDEAIRLGDRELFNLAKDRFRRFVEMSWDHVYGGVASGDFVVGSDNRKQGTYLGEKTMWMQCEAMRGCMLVLEYTGEPWAADWYKRVREFTLRTVANNGIGVWAQTTDRQGRLVVRGGYHPQRKGNFHQPRSLMLNLLSLERMISNHGRLTAFPGGN